MSIIYFSVYVLCVEFYTDFSQIKKKHSMIFSTILYCTFLFADHRSRTYEEYHIFCKCASIGKQNPGACVPQHSPWCCLRDISFDQRFQCTDGISDCLFCAPAGTLAVAGLAGSKWQLRCLLEAGGRLQRCSVRY